MSAGIARRLAAEAGGAAALVATVVGSGIMAQQLTGDVAVQLLCNALPTAAMLVVLIALLSPISGAHLNPMVSLVMALRRTLSWRDALAYGGAQIAGGIAGTWLAHLMFELPVLQLSQHVRTGSGQWLAEGIASFGLVAVILIGTTRRTNVAALVGAYIGAAYWFTASTAFANPAVTVARMLTDSFAGIRPLDAPLFIVAQLAGGGLAALAAAWLGNEKRPGIAPGPLH